MNLKIITAAAACTLSAVGAASAQTIYTTDPAYIEPAPAYTYVAPGVVPTPGFGYFPGDRVAPQVMVVEPTVVAPAPYTVQSAPRSSRGYYGVNYRAPLSCTIDAFGNRICE